MNFFDFLNSINHTKVNLIRSDPLSEKEYNAFMVNRGLSYHYDTVFYANEMNCKYQLDKKMQYEFYLNSIPKKKRFSKWHKSEKHKDVDLLSLEYGYSKKKSLEVLDLIKEEDLKSLRLKYETGGR